MFLYVFWICFYRYFFYVFLVTEFFYLSFWVQNLNPNLWIQILGRRNLHVSHSSSSAKGRYRDTEQKNELLRKNIVASCTQAGSRLMGSLSVLGTLRSTELFHFCSLNSLKPTIFYCLGWNPKIVECKSRFAKQVKLTSIRRLKDLFLIPIDMNNVSWS